MGCRILYDERDDRACLYDSVTETAFGLCFNSYEGPHDVYANPNDVAQAFCDWVYDDPRSYTTLTCLELQNEFLRQLCVREIVLNEDGELPKRFHGKGGV